MRFLILILCAACLNASTDYETQKETLENFITEIEVNRIFVEKFKRFNGPPSQITVDANALLYHLYEVGSLGVQVIYTTVENLLTNTTYNRTLAGHAAILFGQLVGALDSENSNLPIMLYASEKGQEFDEVVDFINSHYELFLNTDYINTKQAWLWFSTEVSKEEINENVDRITDIFNSALESSLFECNQVDISTFCVATTNNLIKMLIMDSALRAVKEEGVRSDLARKLGIAKKCIAYLKGC